MKKYFVIVLAILSIACAKIKNDHKENIKTKIKSEENYLFKEIGNILLPSTNFPKKWHVQIYNEEEPMSKNDSVNQKRLESLDFFDSIKSKKIVNNEYERDLIGKENTAKIDSIFLIDSGVWNDKELIYIKSYKTILEKGYDFPPTKKDIDLLIYKGNMLLKKINIYSDENYPFFKKLKIGYLNKSGVLFTKSFEIDEEGVNFVSNEKQDLIKIIK